MSNTPYEIESGIPIPERFKGHKKYPLGELEIGQSIFIPLEPGDTAQKLRSRMQSTITRARKGGKQFVARTIGIRPDDIGLRIWRTK